jgi:hypothetical protein
MEETGCKTLWIGDILYYYRTWSSRITNVKSEIKKYLSEEEILGKSYSELLDTYNKRK